MSEVKLSAEPRTEFGKGAARRLRRAHMVPAVLYGHGTAPVHVALPGHATMLALKHSNTLPIPEERRFPQLTVLSIAPLIARAIREVFDDGSVTSLFDGNS